MVGVDAIAACEVSGDGVSGSLVGGDCVGVEGGINTAGRDEQAVSQKRAAIANQLCKTLVFGAIWVYNLS